MKKLLYIIWGIWCAGTCFISPFWLTMTLFDLTGLIYQYDGFVDEGTAGIIGVIELLLWLIFTLLPDIAFIRKVHRINRKYLIPAIGGMALMCLLGMAVCGFNITTPEFM